PFSLFGEQLKSALNNSKVTCQQAPEKLGTSGIFVILFIFIFALLAVIGSSITGYEYFMEINVEEKKAIEQNASERPHFSSDIENITAQKLNIEKDNKQNTLPEWLKKCKPFFNCFCLFTNGEKILNTSSEGQLLCLHGIRFLSMCWVILCHGYATVFQSIKQQADIGEYIDHWTFQLVLNGFYSVDSFYFLSGFLVAFVYFKQAAKTDGKIPWVYFYVHRFIRLTPVYMMILAVYSTLHSYFGSGPLWPDANVDPNCTPEWWWNLLYINNFLPSKCMGWTWYMATDMQMYIISPLFLITLWRWPKVGYSVLGFFFILTFATNFILTYVYKLVAGLGNVTTFSNLSDFMPLWKDYTDIIYIKPYTRLGPYLLGIALAYYLHKRKETNSNKLSMGKLFVGWLVSSGITLFCIFGLYHQEVSVAGAAFYNSLSRTGFACGLAWVMFVCIIEQGGIVNSILSWKLWVPMSRLTFCAYLIHPIIQVTYFSSVRSLIDLSHTTMMMYYLAFIITAFSTAFLTSLLFESPIIRVERFVRNKFAS
ncbi:nose resistant to fluoxetine protein 6, partial [Nephila pilipes]